MNILHISDKDIVGGAARAAFKLHSGLIHEEVDSKMWVLKKVSQEKEVIPFSYSKKASIRIRRRLRANLLSKQIGKYRSRFPEGFERFSDDRSFYYSEIPDWIKSTDLVNLHQVSRLLDYTTFFSYIVKNAIPVVWRLADMEPLTGGCHYDWDCNRFVIGCGMCPQLGSDQENDLSAQIWWRKKQAFDKVPKRLLHIVVLSKWMMNKVKESPLLKDFPVHLIPNGVDLNVFRPLNKSSIRKGLGLPADKFIVLILADSLDNKRKGSKYALDALNTNPNAEKFMLVSVGDFDKMPDISIPHRHFEKSLDNRFLSKLYNAVDIFLCTSIYDNFPNTVIEAMACGTPCVCFDTGGASDIVDDSVNGFKVKPKSIEALREKINALSESQELLRRFSSNCVTKAIKYYDVLLQANKYHSLYKSILRKSRGVHI